ncbi:MAG: hypothetical protein U1A78_04405 [Polyangia bacterium]
MGTLSSSPGSAPGSASGRGGLSRRALLLGTAPLVLPGIESLRRCSRHGVWRRITDSLTNLLTDWRTEVPLQFDDLSLAYRRARRRGRPLLVRLLWSRRLSDADAERRGVYADLLRYGEVHELAPLALCEPLTLCFDEVPAMYGLSRLKAGADFLFIETTGRRMQVTPLSVPSVELRIPRSRVPRPVPSFCGVISAREQARFEQKEAAYQEALRAERAPYLWAQRVLRFEQLAQAIATAVAPDPAALARRAREAVATLSSREEELVEQALARRAVPDEPLCQKAAARIALAAAQTQSAAHKERCLVALAAAVVARGE